MVVYGVGLGLVVVLVVWYRGSGGDQAEIIKWGSACAQDGLRCGSGGLRCGSGGIRWAQDGIRMGSGGAQAGVWVVK